MKNLSRKYFRVWGVYRIYSLIDGRSYIGSSNNLYKRINYHMKALVHGYNTYELQKYYNEYGLDAMDVEVLELIPTHDRGLMLSRESYYIQLFNAAVNGFNKCPRADDTRGWAWNSEQRANLKVIAKENGVKYRQSLLGRLQLAREAKIRNPIIIDWWIGRKHTKESKEKIRKARAEQKPTTIRAVIQYSLDGTHIAEFNSIIDAQRVLGICAANIGRCCRGGCHKAGGFKWKYKS